jgi:hypothetical protein
MNRPFLNQLEAINSIENSLLEISQTLERMYQIMYWGWDKGCPYDTNRPVVPVPPKRPMSE